MANLNTLNDSLINNTSKLFEESKEKIELLNKFKSFYSDLIKGRKIECFFTLFKNSMCNGKGNKNILLNGKISENIPEERVSLSSKIKSPFQNLDPSSLQNSKVLKLSKNYKIFLYFKKFQIKLF